MLLISVIVPVYNTQKYLECCVESLVGQTYPNLEIILVDDGSKDESGKMCDTLAEKYDKVRVVHKPNGGLSSARNAGLAVAQGEYVGFVDSDDWVSPNMFGILMENAEAHHADVSACDFIHEYPGEQKKEHPRSTRVEVLDREALYRKTIHPDEFAGYACNKIYRRSAIGALRFDESLSSCEDIDFVSKFVASCERGVYEATGLYHYLHHDASMTGERNFSMRKIAVIDVYERLIALYQKVMPECLPTIQTNYLKINLNVKGRYRVSHTDHPEILKRLNSNIKKYFRPVMKNRQVSVATKGNILLTRLMPGLMLRSKQLVQRKVRK